MEQAAYNIINLVKKNSLVFLITALAASVSQASDVVKITSVRSGAESASGKCSYPGVENEFDSEGNELAGGAFAGNIDLEVKNNRITKLDAKVTGTSCRVSLDTFSQINVGNNNIVLKNSDDCRVVISFRSETVIRADGTSYSNPVSGLKNAVMTFGVVNLERDGACSKLCPELAAAKKTWTVVMNPRTDECGH